MSTLDEQDLNGAIHTRAECCHTLCRHKPMGGVCKGLRCCWFKRGSDSVICAGLALCILGLFVGIIGPVLLDAIIEDGINQGLVVSSKDSPGYDGWQANTGSDGQPVSYDIYLWHVANPDDVLQGARPQMVEVGPICYREHFQKFDVEFLDHGREVRYNQQTWYTFDAERTPPGISDQTMITQTNTVAMFLEYVVKEYESALQQGVEVIVDQVFANLEQQHPLLTKPLEKAKAALEGELASTELWEVVLKLTLCVAYPDSKPSPFYQRSAHDLYWGYFNDPIMTIIADLLALANQTISTSVVGIDTNYTSIEDARRRRGMDTVYTGKGDLARLNAYKYYQNSTQTWFCLSPTGGNDALEEFPACPPPQYEWTPEQAAAAGYVSPFATDFANRVEGTDGTGFKTQLSTDQLQVYVDDIYRVLFFEHTATVTDFHGIPLKRFTIKTDQLANADEVPDNAQFYAFGYSGLENLTHALGFPYFASKPHFLDADPAILEPLLGVAPNRDVHDTYLDIERNSGAALRIRERLQTAVEIYNTDLPAFPNTANATLLLKAALALVCAENQEFCATVEPLVQCMAEPVKWNIYGGYIILPFAWVSQYYDARTEDVDSVKNDIYGTQAFAKQLQFWAFMSAGLAFVVAGLGWIKRRIFVREVDKHGMRAMTVSVKDYDEAL